MSVTRYGVLSDEHATFLWYYKIKLIFMERKSIGYNVENYLYSDDSNIAGKGLFTSRKIKKGEVAFIMKGPKIVFHPSNKKEALTLPNIVGINEDLYIDPISPYVFINHKCDPNVAMSEGGDTFFALRDIEIGEELTFDYSISEYSDWEMECNCGSDNCRKVIKSIDKLPMDYFLKYFPYIPNFFQKVFIEKYIKDNEKNI